MTRNYVLRSVRSALELSDSEMARIFSLVGHEIDMPTLAALLKKEDEQGYLACSDKVLRIFLDGLIIRERGKREGQSAKVEKSVNVFTNNDILKKLRIALELREDDMLAVFKLGNVDMSPSELTALFRKQGHKHYKECGDQFLRYFLKGLYMRFNVKQQS
jgi:uncharacterized protein YehS (DUF1456 family)